MVDITNIIILLLTSGALSGLTLGFFSLNKADLERKANLGDPEAKKIYSIRKNGNRLLCTLIVANVAINTTLSIILDKAITGLLAIIVATALIVIFGEVVPQALFSRYALKIGSKFVWFIKILMWVLYPICWPMAKILDRYLGDEMPTIYSKKELMKLIEEHEHLENQVIDADEEKIIRNAMCFSEKTVRSIMRPRTSVTMLDYDQKLDHPTLKQINRSGHSRIPVYKGDKDRIVGILYPKDLLGIDVSRKTAGNMARKKVLSIKDSEHLDDLLHAFKLTKTHLFIVKNEFGEFSGIVSIDDLVEQIIGDQIPDDYLSYRKSKEDKKKFTFKKSARK